MDQQQIDSLKEALKHSPENLPLRKILAETLYKMARFDEAIDAFKNVLDLSPNDNFIKLQLADSYFNLEKSSIALIILEEITENQDYYGEALLHSAKIHYHNNDLKEAKELYEKALKVNQGLLDEEFAGLLYKKIIDSGMAMSNGPEMQDDDIEQILLNASIEKPKISFKDVGGMASIKEEISLKVIYPLTNPEIYKAYGKKTGGGILLYGPPGVGKTMLARATAGEIKANFISVGINEVLDMWIGNSEKNLHEIFQSARVNAPCVLFFDEVDALGASRTDMRKAAGRFLINQFLDELDGIKYSNEGLLILGATNCPWYLDAAFRRPGRFDRVIFVQPPDVIARKEILQLFLKDKPTESINYEQVAKLLDDYSGADIKAVIDLAIEGKLPQSLKEGRVIAINNNDLKNAIEKHRPTTKEWFATAKNYALYSNESGAYDDILKYLKLKK